MWELRRLSMNKGLLGTLILAIAVVAFVVIVAIASIGERQDIKTCLNNGYDYEVVGLGVVYCIGVRDGNTIVIPASELEK